MFELFGDDMPHSPDKYYEGSGWEGWAKFLGTNNKHWATYKSRSFIKARKYIRQKKFKNVAEYRTAHRAGLLPEDIPFTPNVAYRAQWKGWPDFLGNSNVSNVAKHRGMLPYAKAQAHVKALELNTQEEYRLWSSSGNRPQEIPSAPNRHYSDNGWIDWPSWLGSRNRPKPLTDLQQQVVDQINSGVTNKSEVARRVGIIPQNIFRILRLDHVKKALNE
jgi:hypothetical protein